MADAPVGDDLFREDPTVNRLEQEAAEIFERESALFVPSGTMANQIAVKVHTKPGQEVIVEGKVFINEVPVEELQHYAEDAGKTPEEIAAITEPEKTFSFEADGVLLRQ